MRHVHSTSRGLAAPRPAGVNSAARHLFVQGFNTPIDPADNFFTLPSHPAAHRPMAAVHEGCGVLRGLRRHEQRRQRSSHHRHTTT